MTHNWIDGSKKTHKLDKSEMTDRLKEEVVRYALEVVPGGKGKGGTRGASEAGRAYGISNKTVHNWIDASKKTANNMIQHLEKTAQRTNNDNSVRKKCELISSAQADAIDDAIVSQHTELLEQHKAMEAHLGGNYPPYAIRLMEMVHKINSEHSDTESEDMEKKGGEKENSQEHTSTPALSQVEEGASGRSSPGKRGRKEGQKPQRPKRVRPSPKLFGKKKSR